MKITVISGCDTNQPLQSETLNQIINQLDTAGKDYRLIDLSKNELKYCIGCDTCQTVNPGVCAINDGLNDLLKQYLISDSVTIITPIQFGCFNSPIKNFIDRTMPLCLPYQVFRNGKTIMKPRYRHYPDLIFIGVVNRSDIESGETFREVAANCALASLSSKVEVEIVAGQADLNKLPELGRV